MDTPTIKRALALLQRANIVLSEADLDDDSDAVAGVLHLLDTLIGMMDDLADERE